MNKKSEISFLNVLFCLIVIFIHIASAPVSSLDKGSAQYALIFVPWRLSAFVVQGFIFLSGMKMFLKPPEKTDYRKYYISRVKKIILPYILAVFVFYVYFVRRGYFPFAWADFFGYVLNGNLVSHFYFVIIIAQFYLLRPLWDAIARKAAKNKCIKIAVCAFAVIITLFSSKYLSAVIKTLFGIDFVYSDRVFTKYLIYWIWGMLVGMDFDGFKKSLQNRRVIYLIFAVIAVAETILSYRHFTGELVAYIEEMHFLYSIVAIAFCCAAAVMLGDNADKSKLFKKINGASYYIYLVHPLVIFVADEKLELAGITDIGTAFLLRGICVYVVSVSACIAYTEIKRRILRRK